MDSPAFAAATSHGARRGQRESSYHPMASDSESDGGISDGDPPDYAGGPRPAPIAPPPSLGSGGAAAASRKRSFEELEDIVFSNPKNFVSLANDIATARNVPLMIGDDRTHKVSSAYMHVHCAYRRGGCPFIIKLTKAKEGGWLIRGSKAPELDTKQRSSYRCRHPAGAKPDLSAGTSMAAWLRAADRTTSHPEGGARPKAAKSRSASSAGAGAGVEKGAKGDGADAMEPSAAGKAPRASTRGSGARNGAGVGAPVGRMGGAGAAAVPTSSGSGIEPERALAPPFQRAIDRQAQIVPALSPRHQPQQQQHAYGGAPAGYSPRGGFGYAPPSGAYPLDGMFRSTGTSPSQLRGAAPSPRLPLVAAADPAALPDWTALLTLVGDADLLPLARVLASPLVACTPGSFFAEGRDARAKLLEQLPEEATGLWPKIKLARRLGGEEGERAWAQMKEERNAGPAATASAEGSRSASERASSGAPRAKEEELDGEAEATPAPTGAAAQNGVTPSPAAGFSAPRRASTAAAADLNGMDVAAPVPSAQAHAHTLSPASAAASLFAASAAAGLIVASPPPKQPLVRPSLSLDWPGSGTAED